MQLYAIIRENSSSKYLFNGLCRTNINCNVHRYNTFISQTFINIHAKLQKIRIINVIATNKANVGIHHKEHTLTSQYNIFFKTIDQNEQDKQ